MTWCPLAILIALAVFPAVLTAAEPMEPRDKVIHPFNGVDLEGFVPYLRPVDRAAARDAYSVKDGAIRISGEGMGYLATADAYKNYHLKIEYKWGERTDGSKYVRNSGILLHANGPDGNAKGIWMASIEVQLAQGCEGDFILIRGDDEAGKPIPVALFSSVTKGKDGRPRWDPSGERTAYTNRQFWWSDHQVGFEELKDTRGEKDVASPLGEWTLVECICRDDTITVKINGRIVNKCDCVTPSAGKILLENESNEIYFRNFEICPLPEAAAAENGD
ncbi:DUF1080 domain-containing protein [Blastopirellula sp. JC732]|uniref:DUF1080 domain-containing protein n=1 Tax=Blastopirellula sediminis TaxID=2894196 RepID=A0A9X1SET7_9BACT|nr:DUF1080 domain-containing protein [Blastopirellula sediminis]MCC9608953.1 DUF1080 domain-containing protein [Blastopirellula sediminis]MCC9628270.1 DUF1080 domain-containing protein [Blastopirellula sediminis]